MDYDSIRTIRGESEDLFVLNQRYDLDVMAGQFGVRDPDQMGGRRTKTEKEWAEAQARGGWGANKRESQGKERETGSCDELRR